MVTVPALNGLTTEGDTLKEARAVATDAIRCYLSIDCDLFDDGLANASCGSFFF